MEKITGKNNELIKSVKKLLSSSGSRRAERRFVLEGARLVFDALNSFYKIKIFMVTEQAYDKYCSQCDSVINSAQRSYIISQEAAAKLGDTQNSQGVFAVCEMRSEGFEPKQGGRYIALDNVQDPGNLGAIIRTAEALGIDGVIIGGGCDVYNPKVLRASMGSVLRVNALQQQDISDVLREFKDIGFSIFAAVPNSGAVPVTDIDFSKGAVCVIGNEANGVSAELIELSDRLVTIKMLGKAESLNASVAASIIMWEMLR